MAAMRSELRPLVQALSLRERPSSAGRVYEGRAAGVGIVATTTDMGTEAATRRTGALLEGEPIDHVIVVGIAGGVDPALDIGALVIPETVVHRHAGVSTTPLALTGATASGTILTSDDLHYGPEVVAGLIGDGVTAVDMETGAIGAVCEERGVPWSAYRAISDRVDADAVDYDVYHLARPDGSPDPRAAARYLLTRPSRIPYLIRLARGSRVAIDRAARAVVAAVEEHDFARRGG